MLVLDVFDNWVPAEKVRKFYLIIEQYLPSVVVDLVTITRSIHNIQSQSYSIFLNDWFAVNRYTSMEDMPHVLCETVWISVVARTGSSGLIRPFESMRCDAKMVLINVDFPNPVWPSSPSCQHALGMEGSGQLTNTNDVELETSLQQLLLYLRCDAVETDVAPREHSILLLHHLRCSHCRTNR